MSEAEKYPGEMDRDTSRLDKIAFRFSLMVHARN